MKLRGIILSCLASIKAVNSGGTSSRRRKPLAILHVGPRKTGSTAIQYSMRAYESEFTKDKYALPVPKDWHNLEKCLGVKTKKPGGAKCKEELFAKQAGNIKKALKQSMNVIVSSEGFDNKEVEFDKVEELLSGFDIHVVVVYRRFFDWLVSLYGEMYRQRVGGHYYWDDWDHTKIKNIRTYLEGRVANLHGQFFSTVVFTRYQSRFNASLVNTHASDDVVQEFFCHEPIHATNACSAKRVNKHKPAETRKGDPPSMYAYDEVVVAAHKSGLLDGNLISRVEAREAVRHRQEEELNISAADLPQDCVTDETLELIEKLSIEAEQQFFPSFFKSEKGEKELRSKFETAKAKLCAVDTEKVLSDSSWRHFLSNLGKDSPGNRPLTGKDVRKPVTVKRDHLGDSETGKSEQSMEQRTGDKHSAHLVISILTVLSVTAVSGIFLWGLKTIFVKGETKERPTRSERETFLT